MPYIYLMYCREFIRTGEDIYKVGRTSNLMRRFYEYPKGSRLLFSQYVDDDVSAERKVLAALRTRFTSKTDYGSEYFEGELPEMVREVVAVLDSEWNQLEKNNVVDFGENRPRKRGGGEEVAKPVGTETSGVAVIEESVQDDTSDDTSVAQSPPPRRWWKWWCWRP